MQSPRTLVPRLLLRGHRITSRYVKCPCWCPPIPRWGCRGAARSSITLFIRWLRRLYSLCPPPGSLCAAAPASTKSKSVLASVPHHPARHPMVLRTVFKFYVRSLSSACPGAAVRLRYVAPTSQRRTAVARHHRASLVPWRHKRG